jgi:hypothetical protein
MESQDGGAVDVRTGTDRTGTEEMGSGPDGARPRWDPPTITTFKIGETLGLGVLAGDGVTNMS